MILGCEEGDGEEMLDVVEGDNKFVFLVCCIYDGLGVDVNVIFIDNCIICLCLIVKDIGKVD